MTRIKAYNPDVKIIESEKSRFLSNTPEDEARRIMKVFGDVCIGKPQGTVPEGVVGVYEILP